jgi:tripartite-type tricarboxylate transporter receptor subunit TctC
MAAALFTQDAHIDLLHVPYKGAGPAFTDLMGGQVQMMIATMSLALPHAKSGKVRALAVTGEQRVAAAPDIPTVAEAGLPGYSFATWYGLFAPAGTPAVIVQHLNRETANFAADSATRARLAAQGLDMVSDTPDAFAGYLRREVERWARVVKASGVYAR